MTNREIDALVAERCMGLTIHALDWPCWMEWECGTWIAAADPGDSLNVDCLPMPVFLVSEDPLIVEPVANYSTDPAASKTLRNKMRADGWRYVVQALAANDLYIARFWSIKDTRGTLEGNAYETTEESAVALAALQAVGIEMGAILGSK